MTTISTPVPLTLSPVCTPQAWTSPLDALMAKGRTTARPGSLAGLAEARRTHQGQFFTPAPVAALMWRAVLPTVAAMHSRRLLHLLDTSVGSGRLFQFADPTRCTLTGVDVDEACIAALHAARTPGLTLEVECVGLESCRPTGYDIALLNPPFSLTLQSPHLVPGASTSYGPFGPHTSTTSQWYALEQGLRAASVVVILMPAQDVDALVLHGHRLVGEAAARLTATITLPAGSFRSEGTDVATAIAVFGPTAQVGPVTHWTPASLDAETVHATCPIPAFPLATTSTPRLRAVHHEASAPRLTGPVTGNPVATLHHDGRRLVVRAECAFTQARAGAAISEDLLPDREKGDRTQTKRPASAVHIGSFRLNREALLMQDDWQTALNALIARCADVGVQLTLSPTLRGHLARYARQTRRQAAPFGRVVYDPDGLYTTARPQTGRVRRPIVSDPTKWGAPALRAGTAVRVTRNATGTFTVASDTMSLTLTEGQVRRDLELDAPLAETPTGGAWSVVAPPLAETFPQEVGWWRARLAKTGATAWLRDYQAEDVAELLCKPRGAVAGWGTGLGKSRLAAALARTHGGRRTVVVVPSRLIEEMEQQWALLDLPDGWYKVVRQPADLDWTVPVLLIATERLRQPVARGAKRTVAHLLRRRVSLLIADEADYLANPNSEQTRALRQLSARRRILMTATPVANYPRDIVPVVTFACGDGTAAMPAGWFQPACDRAMWHADRARDGRAAIMEDFMTLQWVTPEFTDTLREGAKREVPVIKDLPKFRALIERAVKRRVHAEPAVRQHIQIPAAEWLEPVRVEWDEAHLAHFLRVADEFASWYREYRKDLLDGKRGGSQLLLLARIGAVERAGNDPMHATHPTWTYHAPTSKQRAVVETIAQLANAGHRTITYARHPSTVEWIGRALAARGQQAVLLHGQRSIRTRLDDLQTRFREGDVPNIVCTFGTGDRGLNLPEADQVLLLDRDWSAKVETQCVGRTLRPQQRRTPQVRPFHLPGSLDDYMAMLTRFKHDSNMAGVDWGTPTMQPEDFVHLDTVINAFVENLAALRGMTSRAFRDHLKGVA